MNDQKYYPQLNTLRAFAAFAVINLHWLNSEYPKLFGINHISNWGFGHYGVQLFFVLSGFLITNILINTGSSKSIALIIKNFYIRRFLRLFPLYYLFLVFLILLKDEFVTENIGWFLTYTVNFKFYSVGGLVDVWSNHLWTLSIEEQFYLVFPFLILLIKRKHAFFIPIVLIVVSLIFKFMNQGIEKPFNLLTITQLDMLGAGVGLALIKNRLSETFNLLTGKIGKTIMMVSLFACIWVYYFVDMTPEIWLTFDCLLLLAFSLLVANATNGFSGIVGRVFDNKVLIYLGKVSYGLYVYHKIVPLSLLIILKKIDIQIDSILIYYIINLIILLVVTHLSWILVEKPMLKFKSKFEYKST
jgi:peptidoglycan/LPS O-acetylase OafA/YrhL